MTREWCAKCQSIQNVNIARAEKLEKDNKNQKIKVIIKSYQCSVCCSFIRSEEEKEYTTDKKDVQHKE